MPAKGGKAKAAEAREKGKQEKRAAAVAEDSASAADEMEDDTGGEAPQAGFVILRLKRFVLTKILRFR